MEQEDKFFIDEPIGDGVVTFSIPQKMCWSIAKTNIPKTWEITKGADMTAMVIDTGHPIHRDIGDNAIEGRSFITGRGSSIIDRNGHGTHVTGIICAKDNDIGMVGVAPQSRVVSVKALDDNGSGSLRGIEDALTYATVIKPDVVCMSLGSTSGTKKIHDLIRKLYDLDIPVVCAAGNNGYHGGINYPAKYPETIAVAAFDENGRIANFSARGPEVDWAGPGVGIYSTWLNHSYKKLDGTSMATPYIVGVILLLLSKHRIQEKETGKNDCKTVEQVREHLGKYTVDKGMVGRDNYWGYGVVDVERLIVGGKAIEPVFVAPKRPAKQSFYQKILRYLGLS